MPRRSCRHLNRKRSRYVSRSRVMTTASSRVGDRGFGNVHGSSQASLGSARAESGKRTSEYPNGMTFCICTCRPTVLRVMQSTAVFAWPRISIRYLAGLRDDLIRQIGWELLSEIREPTSTAQLRAQSLAHMLTTRIAERYASGVGDPNRCRGST